MNYSRRRGLKEVVYILDKAADKLDTVMEGEMNALDNMPESFIGGTLSERMEDATDHMQSALDSIRAAQDELEEAIGC